MDPHSELRHRLKRLHRDSGEPATRDIARRTGDAISHTTVASVLRGDRLPRWGQLELVVEALNGDREEFRRLWVATRDAAENSSQERPAAADPAPAEAPPSYAPSAADYFCYVSRSKVERLYAAGAVADEGASDPTGEPTVGAASVGELFRMGGTFGRPHLLTHGSARRAELMRQLRHVLTGLAANGAIGWLQDEGAVPQTRYVAYTGVFHRSFALPPGRADDPAVDVVSLTGSIPRSDVRFDCSLRYFSEAVDEKYVVTSENHWFLQGGGSLLFDTVFLRLHHEPGLVIGSPLFLKLRSSGQDIAL